MPVIDAHQHFWNPAKAPYDWLDASLGRINRAFEWDDLAPLLAATGVEATVLVQSADNLADTDYMFAIAADHREIAAVVAWAPLDRPAETANLLPELMTRPGFVGIRNLIHTKPDPDWLLRPDVGDSLGLLEAHGVPLDVVSVLPRHLQHVPTISARHPELNLVIDHLSKPPILGPDEEPWKSLIIAAAENPRVHAKLSGLYPAVGDLERWTVDDLRPYVEFAFEQFGPQRLMWGGDWPISILAGGYVRVWDAFATIFAELDAPDREAVLGGTAATFYRIDPRRLTDSDG